MQVPILEVKGLKKHFGGVKVLEDVNFVLKKGEFKTIIGPNGAGKTTIYNLISGVMKPTGGEIIYKGKNITGLACHKIAAMGLSRSFQITNLFPTLTVHENIRIAAQAKEKGGFNIWKHYSSNKKIIEMAQVIMAQVKLEGKGDLLAKDLTHTEKRKLELGILLAMGGDVLLLDEPTAGVAAEEVPELFKIIEEIKETQNKSILLIEHKIGIIMNISDTIAVLQNGVLIADQSPQEIRNNDIVQQAYFGGGSLHA